MRARRGSSRVLVVIIVHAVDAAPSIDASQAWSVWLGPPATAVARAAVLADLTRVDSGSAAAVHDSARASSDAQASKHDAAAVAAAATRGYTQRDLHRLCRKLWRLSALEQASGGTGQCPGEVLESPTNSEICGGGDSMAAAQSTPLQQARTPGTQHSDAAHSAVPMSFHPLPTIDWPRFLPELHRHAPPRALAVHAHSDIPRLGWGGVGGYAGVKDRLAAMLAGVAAAAGTFIVSPCPAHH
jgi:hypothetical protein